MKFEGNVEAFRYTPQTALETNSLVTVGALVGVTRDSCAAGDTIMAFMTGKKSIYSLPQASGIAADVDMGTLATIADGKVKPAAAGDTIIGVYWEDTDNAAEEAIIMLSDLATSNGAAAATTTAAGLMSAADKEKLDGIGIATTSTAGLVKPDGVTIDVAETTGVISVHST